MRKPFSRATFFLFSFVAFIVGCSREMNLKTAEFPLSKGTFWVYTYHAYDTSVTDPNQIIEAVYQLTETIVEAETVTSYIIVQVRREYQLIHADIDWRNDLSNSPTEFWYIRKDNQLFESNLPIDKSSIIPENLILDYEFPLFINKSWCLLPQDSGNAKGITGCEFVGKREVVSQGSYETPAGNFDSCYDLVDYFNGGNFFQTFCSNVGMVHMKFDHVGSQFGFEKTLVQYSAGVP